MDSGIRTTPAPARPETETTDRGSGGEGRIRCPLCGWERRAENRWACDCLFTWNTFDTGGVCPGCMKQWTTTMCLSCGGWSLHSDWYPR